MAKKKSRSKQVPSGGPTSHTPLQGSSLPETTLLTLFVYMLGLGPSFHIDIERSKIVSELKEAILQENPNSLKGVDARRLTLYKAQIPNAEDVEDAARQALGGASALLVNRQLLDIFPVDPPLGTINIIVDIPNTRGTDVLRNKRKRDEEESGLPPQVKMLKQEISMAAPSFIAHPGLFSRMTGPGNLIASNRPYEPDTIPLVLLHQAFVVFKDRCKAEPSEKAMACLQELAVRGCEWYDTEVVRKPVLLNVLLKYTGLLLVEQKIQGTEFTTDGNLAAHIMPAVIRVCKNEHGHVVNQVIAYYGRFLIKALEDPLLFYNYNTCFPSILIVDAGSHLGFYGAAWDGNRVRVEPLTPMFNLSVHWRENSDRRAIASALDALTVAVGDIEEHYKSIYTEAKANPTPSAGYDPRVQKAREYPFVTSYEDDGQTVTFTYDAQLDGQKLIFSAIPNQPGSEEFLVKFTQRYSGAAHGHLASHGLAPRLRQCVRVSNDWTAVIMDISKYRVLYGLRLTHADQEKVRKKVDSAVQMLHQAGFVHGDIRDTNLLIDVGSLASEDVGIHLIDLDWAGSIGEAKYPVEINKLTVKRPVDVKGGKLITKEHDLEMLSYLF